MVALFIIASIILGLVIAFGMMDDRVMPWTCPACFAGPDEDLLGRYRWWYVVERSGRVRCRTCSAKFEERADGTLGPIHDL
jgi:hypothetical protein